MSTSEYGNHDLQGWMYREKAGKETKEKVYGR